MATYESFFLSSDGVMRRRKRNQFNQDSNEIIRTDSVDSINQSRYKEKVYNSNPFSKDDVQIHKFPRSDYSFVNGIRDDADYLIIVKKGTLDEMAEDATQDPESAKRVDALNKLGYWVDGEGNRRQFEETDYVPEDMETARQRHIESWNKK